jgi:prephenate dehydrogenase
MMQSYIKDLRSVMPTVILINVAIVKQEILEMVAEVDPDDQRTPSVLSKLDLADEELWI